MSANVLGFIDNPLLEGFEKCRKDDLLAIAVHFQISVNSVLFKEGN